MHKLRMGLAALVRSARSQMEKRAPRLLTLARERGREGAVGQGPSVPPSAEPESGLHVEALVLNPELGCLFTDEERALASRTIKEDGRHPS